MDKSILYDRLRRAPSPLSVPSSLPVLFFGDLFSAGAATVSLNPSPQEYLDPDGRELEGDGRRFETLTSLGARSRLELTDVQCDQALDTMRNYYQPGRPVYRWFRSFMRLAEGLALDYAKGEIAHLDLVQEATILTWSQQRKASRREHQKLLQMDERFLSWQLTYFPLRSVFCNGKTPFNEVCEMAGARIVHQERLARLTWFVAIGVASGRQLVVAGWNLPLALPTGLGATGEIHLGRSLRAKIVEIAPDALVP